MSMYLLYALNLLLLLSSLLVFLLERAERRFSLSLIQCLLGLPVMTGVYTYVGYHLESQVVPLLLFSESVFAFTWFFMVYRLSRSTVAASPESRLSLLIQVFVVTVLVALALYYLVHRPAFRTSDKGLVFDIYGWVYFYAVFLLTFVLAIAWRLERFWRALEPARRWEYKFFVVGNYLICGALGWATSYRLTYLGLIPNHFGLLAALLFLAWSLICYAVIRHRLLNRKMFISRRVVYSFITPSIFAAYFVALGLTSLVMGTFGLPLPFVLRWLFIAIGIAAIALFACSGKLRQRIHYFISTHFYVNKYEYRNEWVGFSRRLQGALTEADVVEALRQVLVESLYTNNLIIWLGDEIHGYRPVCCHGNTSANAIAPDDPLVRFLQTRVYFYIKHTDPDAAWKGVAEKKEAFLADLNLVLMAPLLVGDQLIGLIGLGPEFTGGRYGHDDFDLLIAIGTQAASALLAVRMAEKLARERERQAWNTLSAFVLHDVKNAANMLSLARENASDHIQNPQFQHDLLEAVDDALERMAKVQERMSMLKREGIPVWQDLDLCRFLKDRCARLGKKLGAMRIALDCRTGNQVQTDPILLSRILENLLLNALEAGGDGTAVRIKAFNNEDQGQAIIEIADSGPGIPESLLPNALFEPYKTTKPNGTGIGLWQVDRLVTTLRGTISAENVAEGGTRFVLRLPLVGVKKFNRK